MNPKLKEKLLESLMAVLPITLIVLALSVALVPMDVGTAVMFTVGAVLLVFGMGLFQLGAEMAMTPLGEGIGVGIRQDDTELKAKIDKALCELIDDGSIKASSEKWFKMDISQTCD